MTVCILGLRGKLPDWPAIRLCNMTDCWGLVLPPGVERGYLLAVACPMVSCVKDEIVFDMYSFVRVYFIYNFVLSSFNHVEFAINQGHLYFKIIL